MMYLERVQLAVQLESMQILLLMIVLKLVKIIYLMILKIISEI